MKSNDPIRMSDYHHRRVVAFAPVEAARQFRISAVLAGAIIIATMAVAAGTLYAPSHQKPETLAPSAALAQSRAS